MTTPLKRSQSQEKRIAKRSGGSRNAGSGNGWIRKGDVRSDGVLYEMKRTDKQQITIKLADLEKIRQEAWADGRSPRFHIEIGNRRYVILEESDYEELAGNG